MQDVADEANVSVATVSRVLNESDSVREATKERVLQAARSLDYLINESARSLREQKTRTIGVLLPNVHGEFFAEVSMGLDRRARKNGHHLLMSNSHTEEAEVESVIRSLLGRVDGLVLLWPRLDIEFLEDLVPASLPVMLLNTTASASRFHTLSFDNRAGAYTAVQHLAEHGHERVAILSGGPVNFDAQERLAGYRNAVQDFGLVADSALELEGNFTRESGHAAVDRMLDLDPVPTALFASNDSMALGALRRFHETGRAVPEDVAVVGFDDIPTTRFATPSLSTVHVPMQELGERAMQRLLDVLQNDGPPPSHQTLDTRLIRRESCGCSSTE